ncbi:hypothetical protein LX70_04022 [Defluviimonas denitrificans]|jgi:hypothetical protein|uniref:ABM domain-containing protein n=1 Tax=Albidovulum denitrificans TaxID=404881 RepID=A0A2S8RWI1_9RHOB|nr:hypothetical protein [Defluviimonas denitrificans]PQV52916.1 hypothetical protein LX70_04022 [Defluviimonas denitrificans]
MADKFLKVSRGFANTVIYFRVPENKVSEADAAFATFEDENPGCYAKWVSGQGLGDQPVMWEDRAYAGY